MKRGNSTMLISTHDVWVSEDSGKVMSVYITLK